MGTHQDNGFRDTERCCTYHNTACDCSDTARACVDGLQRPWRHGWLGRSFQYGLPVRLERAWRTRRRDEFKDVTSMFHLCIRLRALNPAWQRVSQAPPSCVADLLSTYHTVFIANLSVRPLECFQTVDQELEELLSQVAWMKC